MIKVKHSHQSTIMQTANRNLTRSIAWTYHVTSRCIEIDIARKRDLVGTYTQSVLYLLARVARIQSRHGIKTMCLTNDCATFSVRLAKIEHWKNRDYTIMI